MAEEKAIFNELNSIDVSSKIEKKNGLSYLSWAWAWGELKKAYPSANYTVYENKDGWNYFTDGKTCWVKCGVTVEGIEHVEYLPVMDFKNKSIPANNVTSFDVNKAIQRCVTKAIARHGLGLYIYAGEDLPNDSKSDDKTNLELDLEALLSEHDKDLTDEVKSICNNAIKTGKNVEDTYNRLISYLSKKGIAV